jgi:hypothetical protein
VRVGLTTQLAAVAIGLAVTRSKAEAIRKGETEQLPPNSQPPGTVANTDVFVGIDTPARPPE